MVWFITWLKLVILPTGTFGVEGVIVNAKFVLAGTLADLNAKGRLVVRGSHRPILILGDQDRVYAFDNRCPHMGFPLDRGSVEDGILTCHWHHARFDLASGVHLRPLGG